MTRSEVKYRAYDVNMRLNIVLIFDLGDALGSEENYSLLWISLLSKATMNLYVNQIFSIPKLTIAGGHQLSVDIGKEN